ncbi:uncharacterized protein LOC125071392 [Vanessa atalanta]|uniref:uncharacterized protein LOC125071392 n=1 Tax=Vanessa atalanta TaxID=42275 RepID=UPI001FCD2B53|nr:uncharacterized protein LOC125071392 [Vanessa atalanta]XP_047537572.1 uncharacterized protein LOC125071392 [Vanessa atalanta]
MEQIFMIEVFVKKIVLKIEPPEKDEYELKMEEEERKREAEALAAAEAAKKGKKEKPAKKGKKGKEPPLPSEEEMKFMQTCTMQFNCLPLFDFYVAHDNFIPPPPPPPPGKGKKPPKPKGKKGKVQPVKIELPSEPLPQPPYFGVGNSIMFLSRPSKLEEVLKKTPIYITVWNRDQEMNCVGFCVIEWHESFFDCLKRSAELNPVNMDQAEYRDTSRPEMVTNTVELTRPLQCEEDLKASGEIEFFIRLTCMGNRVISYFVALPEMERLPGRKYLSDDLKLKDVEVVRHWEGTTIDAVPPVAYFFGAPDIIREPIKPVEEPKVYDDFVAPYASSELAILAMGFPKGPCGGTNCPKRMDYRGSQHQFIHGETVKGKYHHGQFVNKRDVHGPCGRLDCPLAKKVRAYLCSEGSYKPCKKPCNKDYY